MKIFISCAYFRRKKFQSKGRASTEKNWRENSHHFRSVRSVTPEHKNCYGDLVDYDPNGGGNYPNCILYWRIMKSGGHVAEMAISRREKRKKS